MRRGEAGRVLPGELSKGGRGAAWLAGGRGQGEVCAVGVLFQALSSPSSYQHHLQWLHGQPGAFVSYGLPSFL